MFQLDSSEFQNSLTGVGDLFIQLMFIRKIVYYYMMYQKKSRKKMFVLVYPVPEHIISWQVVF